jgi:hypothetical protein
VIRVDDWTVVSFGLGRLGLRGELVEIEASAEVSVVAAEDAYFLSRVVFEVDEGFV